MTEITSPSTRPRWIATSATEPHVAQFNTATRQDRQTGVCDDAQGWGTDNSERGDLFEQTLDLLIRGESLRHGEGGGTLAAKLPRRSSNQYHDSDGIGPGRYATDDPDDHKFQRKLVI